MGDTPHRVDVALGERSYPILIAPGLIDEVGGLLTGMLPSRTVLVIADQTVAGLYGRRLKDSLEGRGLKVAVETVPPGEGSKSLAQAERLWTAAASHRIDRSDTVLAFGGGVIGDLAGFVAACWMRGVRFVQIPTTLLAMVDSSVGGKTGVNCEAGKNLIGAFKQPECVLIDPELLSSMEPREYRAGLAEVLKYGVIRDPAFFLWQEAHATKLAERDPAAVAHAVALSCRIKASYVAEDEFEQGVRAHLNYGHTFGHALERETLYRRYFHGEAVAIGMRMAAALAQQLGMLEDAELPARQDRLLEAFQLPLAHSSREPASTARRLAQHCQLDKKVAHGRIRFILPRRLGAVAVREAPDQESVVAAFASAIVAG
jgi:3-dehydroquinate synthase